MEYTVDFKMVTILATFRRALMLDGIGFEKKLLEYRKTTNRSWVEIDKQFLTKVEMGVEKLNKYEIMLFAEYVSNAIGVECTSWFFNAVKHEADRMKENTPLDATKACSKIICKLYNI